MAGRPPPPYSRMVKYTLPGDTVARWLEFPIVFCGLLCLPECPSSSFLLLDLLFVLFRWHISGVNISDWLPLHRNNGCVLLCVRFQCSRCIHAELGHCWWDGNLLSGQRCGRCCIHLPALRNSFSRNQLCEGILEWCILVMKTFVICPNHSSLFVVVCFCHEEPIQPCVCNEGSKTRVYKKCDPAGFIGFWVLLRIMGFFGWVLLHAIRWILNRKMINRRLYC